MEESKNKIYLYLGIGLPMALLIITITIGIIGRFIEAPQNTVLFVQNSNGFKFRVQNNTISITKDTTPSYYNEPERTPIIIQFNPRTKETEKYNTIKQQDNSYLIKDFPTNLKISPSPVSEDNYEFRCKTHSVFIELFIESNANCILYKQPFKSIIVKDSDRDSVFLGWISNE